MVVFTVVYFLLIFVIGSNLFIQGGYDVVKYLSAHALVFTNVVMGLLYIAYTAYWKGRVSLVYENTDWKRLPLYVSIGILLHIVLSALQYFGILSAVQLIYAYLLGSAYAFVAITENAFFIGVIGDYFTERYNQVIGSIAAGLAALIYHLGVYGYSLRALFIVFIYFTWWAFSSFRTRSTLYADFHHAVGNYFGFIYSVTRVIS